MQSSKTDVGLWVIAFLVLVCAMVWAIKGDVIIAGVKGSAFDKHIEPFYSISIDKDAFCSEGLEWTIKPDWCVEPRLTVSTVVGQWNGEQWDLQPALGYRVLQPVVTADHRVFNQ